VETVLIYTPRRALLLRLLGGITLVAAGVLAISMGGIGYVIGVLGILFFGAASVYLISELVYRRPSLRIDADGITDRATLASAGRIAWGEIGAVRIHSVLGQRFLEILPLDPGAVVARAGPVRRAVLRLNRGVGFPAINIPEAAVPYPLEALIDEIRRHNPDLEIHPDQQGAGMDGMG
jgi:hypothetical protein